MNVTTGYQRLFFMEVYFIYNKIKTKPKNCLHNWEKTIYVIIWWCLSNRRILWFMDVLRLVRKDNEAYIDDMLVKSGLGSHCMDLKASFNIIMKYAMKFNLALNNAFYLLLRWFR